MPSLRRNLADLSLAGSSSNTPNNPNNPDAPSPSEPKSTPSGDTPAQDVEPTKSDEDAAAPKRHGLLCRTLGRLKSVPNLRRSRSSKDSEKPQQDGMRTQNDDEPQQPRNTSPKRETFQNSDSDNESQSSSSHASSSSPEIVSFGRASVREWPAPTPQPARSQNAPELQAELRDAREDTSQSSGSHKGSDSESSSSDRSLAEIIAFGSAATRSWPVAAAQATPRPPPNPRPPLAREPLFPRPAFTHTGYPRTRYLDGQYLSAFPPSPNSPFARPHDNHFPTPRPQRSHPYHAIGPLTADEASVTELITNEIRESGGSFCVMHVQRAEWAIEGGSWDPLTEGVSEVLREASDSLAEEEMRRRERTARARHAREMWELRQRIWETEEAARVQRIEARRSNEDRESEERSRQSREERVRWQRWQMEEARRRMRGNWDMP